MKEISQSRPQLHQHGFDQKIAIWVIQWQIYANMIHSIWSRGKYTSGSFICHWIWYLKYQLRSVCPSFELPKSFWGSQNGTDPQNGYGSIPINTIFRGMNIHLPAILMFTRGTRFWHTAKWLPNVQAAKTPCNSFQSLSRRFLGS